MLKDRDAVAIVAVRDIDRAREFYESLLGLPLVEEGPGDVLVFNTGSTSLMVYPSAEAGSNRANAVVWPCGHEFDAIVADLERKGVAFEHYPGMDDTRVDGNVHVSGPMRLAWFKDPDGNILHINNF